MGNLLYQERNYQALKSTKYLEWNLRKAVRVCFLQVGQAPAMRCRCRARDFDITGRKPKISYIFHSKFCLSAQINLSRS